MTLFLLLLLLLQPSSSIQAASAANVHACRFGPDDDAWKGSCGRLGGEYPAITFRTAKAVTTGRWRKDSEPRAVWAGNITYSDDVVPIEIEIYPDGKGLLKSADGWFPISRSVTSGKAMQLDVDFENEVPPSNPDPEIVQRASAILSSEAVWNRADTRECSPADTKWSIYCAMEKATIEVTSGCHHRRPALQVVRKTVEERSAKRPYTHRLMDYNNDPTTQYNDVQSLFEEALRSMSMPNQNYPK